jgi:hypothetical protein
LICPLARIPNDNQLRILTVIEPEKPAKSTVVRCLEVGVVFFDDNFIVCDPCQNHDPRQTILFRVANGIHRVSLVFIIQNGKW